MHRCGGNHDLHPLSCAAIAAQLELVSPVLGCVVAVAHGQEGGMSISSSWTITDGRVVRLMGLSEHKAKRREQWRRAKRNKARRAT